MPGIFTQDASGKGPGAILNDDYSLNTPAHPASKKKAVMIFATGGGLTNPPAVDGVIASLLAPLQALPVSATVNGEPAKVIYAGGAPLEINGVLQVNIVIPADAPSGPAVPVAIKVGDWTSQDGVTLAIQ
jgi:uncharacterized protein (TIGR03437 family)